MAWPSASTREIQPLLHRRENDYGQRYKPGCLLRRPHISYAEFRVPVASTLLCHTMCPGKVLFYFIKLAAAYAYVHLDSICANGLPCMAQWDARLMSLFHLLANGFVACKAALAPGHMASTTGDCIM